MQPKTLYTIMFVTLDDFKKRSPSYIINSITFTVNAIICGKFGFNGNPNAKF